MMNRFVVFFSFFIFLANNVSAQDNKISINKSGVYFNAIVKEIETKTGYHFYYDEKLLDSLVVSVDAVNTNVKDILDNIFRNSDYKFAVSSNNIFITKDREIRTQLPPDFFNGSISSDNYDIAIFDFMSDGNGNNNKSLEKQIVEVGEKTKNINSKQATIAGYIRDIKTGEPVIGAVVIHEKSMTGVVTNAFGYYTIILPTGKLDLKVSCIGMKEEKMQVVLYSDGNLDIELTPSVIPLKEVVVEADRGANVYRMQMGHEKLDLKTIKQVPMAMGEVDVLKAVLALPGVKSVGESSTGLNVRGGATSQNLILLDGATIYNPSHLFGFFSSFNPDMLKNIELYKSNMPSKFGGRVSSVLEVESKEGNKKKITGGGGISLITSRLNIEGPILKDKISFVIGGRTTYSDWILKNIPDPEIKKSKGSFYDIHAQLSAEINKKNRIFITAYGSHDLFKFAENTTYTYNNIASSLRWKHTFTNRFTGLFSSSYSKYEYNIISENEAVKSKKHNYNINQTDFKADFNYYFNTKHSLSFGASSIYYKLNPGRVLPYGAESQVTPDKIHDEQAIENGLYLEDQFNMTSKFTINIGLRYSLYNYLGPNNILTYEDGLAKDNSTILDTLVSNGGLINCYDGPELRFSARYLLPANSSVKLSYQRAKQYIHMLSNTTSMSPVDIWKLSDPNILPETGDQLALGVYKNFNSNTLEISVEGYYKKMKNFLDYANGAILEMNHTIEQDIINALGTAYGVEFMIKRPKGKLNGWLSYTYSRSLLKPSDIAGYTINKGKEYPSNYDKPHDLTFVGNYRFTRRFSFSANLTYSSGRPITIPIAKYNMYGKEFSYYTDRNMSRIPDYFRTDISLNLEGNHRIRKLAHYSWSFSVYNLTGRNNAYSVFYKSEQNQIKGYKLSIYPKPIPTLTYNFRF